KIPFIPLQNSLLSNCDKIIATSQVYANSSLDLKKYLNKVAIIPIGIDDKRMSIDVDRIKKIKNSYPGKLIVFSLGRHVYYKG
ncbi:glycosyl transferase family 1, partial [Escherichia coli]|nr:glycosyl transferase family 1 [Escherichia coli]